MPILCVGAGVDTIVPARYVRQLSSMLPQSQYVEYAIGHCDLLLKSSGWSAPAAQIASFLNAH
jgi:poly(3-hydroxyalkanoate) synthetase